TSISKWSRKSAMATPVRLALAILALWSSLSSALTASALRAQTAAPFLPPQLVSLSQKFLDSGSRESELHLREYAINNAGSKTAAHAEAGALAYFVLGYKHWQDSDYPQAISYLRLARSARTPLSDYADYYLASAFQN